MKSSIITIIVNMDINITRSRLSDKIQMSLSMTC